MAEDSGACEERRRARQAAGVQLRLVPNAPKGWEQPPNQNRSRAQSTHKAREPRGKPSNAGPLLDGHGLTFEMQSGNDSRPTVVHILHMSRWQAPVTMGQAQTSW